MRTISLQEYLTFNYQQQQMCKKLGIKIQKRAKRTSKNKKPLAPPEYTLRVTTECSLCGTIKISHYRMLKGSKKNNYLKGFLLSNTSIFDKTLETIIPTCSCCYKYLARLTRTELISLYLKAYKTSFNR